MRKRVDKARCDISDEAAAKLEFLWRNPAFRREADAVNALPCRSRREIAKRHDATEELKKKWGLGGFHFPITQAITPDRNLFWLPVRAAPSSDGVLKLELDPRYPDETLLPIIERELGRAREQRNADEISKRPPGAPKPIPTVKRRRLDKAREQIAAYDAVLRCRTYSKAAAELRQPVRNVMNAFRVAWTKIHGDSFPGKRQAKRENLKHGFNPRTHRDTCPECLKEGLCSLALEYVRQVKGSQLGDTGRNLDYELSKRLRGGNLFQSRDALDDVVDYRRERSRKIRKT